MKIRELVKQYMELDRLTKETDSKIKELKPKVQKFLRRCKNIGIDVNGISYRENEKYKFNEDELYEWLKDQVTEEVFKILTREVIDLEKVQRADAEGIIDLSKIPDECYSVIKYPVITVKKEGK